MTMFGMSWGLRVTGVSPLAKLVAIRLGDGCDQDARGYAYVDTLMEWCCAANHIELFNALRELVQEYDVAWAEQSGGRLDYSLPYQARPDRTKREKIDPPGWIYIMHGRIGRKIGITGNLTGRVAGLRLATLDDSIVLEWSATAAMSVIRRAERSAHGALADKLIRNEWFDVSADEARLAVEAAVNEAAGIK